MTVKVTIFDHSQEEHCPWRCGVDWSGEAVAFLTELLKGKYGDEVEVEYVDLAGAQSGERQGVRDRIKARELPLPVVAINGEFRLSGGVDYRSILDAVEAQWEMDSG